MIRGVTGSMVLVLSLLLASMTLAPLAAASPLGLERLAALQRAGIGVGAPSGLVADNFQILGHSNLIGGSPHGDISFYDHGGRVGKHAYVGTWSGVCSGTGVKIVDVNNPAQPVLVGLAETDAGVSTEDFAISRIGGRDILAVGVQWCKWGRVGGLALYDVTTPSRPAKLSFLATPAGGVHELDVVVQADGTALALLAVPFVEFEYQYFGGPAGGDFRIVDITHPWRPIELADWGILQDGELPIVAGVGPVTSQFNGIGYFAAYYAHSVRAADGGRTAYVSFWDGGVLKFDISDPARPVLRARTTYPIDADGDAHSLAILDVDGQRYLLQNDEDFDSLSPVVVTSSATGSAEYVGLEEAWAPTLLSHVGRLEETVHDARDGCEAADYTGAAGRIVLADAVDPYYAEHGLIEGWTVPCSLGQQTLLAAAGGARAFVANLISPDDAWIYFRGDIQRVRRDAGGMPVVMISGIDRLADRIRDAAGPVTMTLTPQPRHLGFIRIYQESAGADLDGDGVVEYPQVGAFELSGESVHNTEVRGNRAYSAWYSYGIVALDLTDPAHPKKVGQFIPASSSAKAGSLGPGPPFVWGVAIDPATGVIYLSEMRNGLWIIQPTGSAASSS